MRDLPEAEVELGAGGGVVREGAGDLFGGHEAEVGDAVVVDGAGEGHLDELGGEVNAVGLSEVMKMVVLAGVEKGDQAHVLFGGGGDLVGPAAAVVRHAGGLPPLFEVAGAHGATVADLDALLAVGNDGAEVALAVLLAERPDDVGGGVGGEVGDGRRLAGGLGADLEEGMPRVGFTSWWKGEEELGDGGGEPVVRADGVVAGEDGAGLTRAAKADVERAVGADVVEVDGGVAERHHGTEAAEGLADEDAERGVGGRAAQATRRAMRRARARERGHRGRASALTP